MRGSLLRTQTVTARFSTGSAITPSPAKRERAGVRVQRESPLTLTLSPNEDAVERDKFFRNCPH
jgi:hypothetical protein